MPTISYPAVGNNGLTDAQWATMYGREDGILEDYHAGGVAACSLTRVNATNVATVSPGLVSVNGYTLEVTAAHDLTVGTAGATYYIAAQYDPALNVADGSGNAQALGPCRLIIATALDTTGGKAYTVLYRIIRAASQELTAATLLDDRRWLGTTLSASRLPASIPPTGYGPYPRGTRMVQTDVGGVAGKVSILERTVNTAGTALEWRDITAPAEIGFPMPSGLVAAGAPPMVRRVFSEVSLSGALKRSSGANLSTSSDVILGTLPAGYRPGGARRYVCVTGGQSWANVIIGSNGVVTMYHPPTVAAFIELSGITFRAEN